MPLLAVLNSRRRLEELISSGDRPAAVATRTREVAEAAAACGLPCVHADDVIAEPERMAIAARARVLVTALAGNEVPLLKDVQALLWWALEWPLQATLVGGARTRRLIEAGLRLAPGVSGIVHDSEGWMQGGVTALTAGALGLPVVGVPRLVIEAMQAPQDLLVCPLERSSVRLAWRGLPGSPSSGATVAVLLTNEVSYLVGPMWNAGVDPLAFGMDARQPWKDVDKSGLHPTRIDAEPVPGAAEAELVEPAWPLPPTTPVEAWEREVAQLMFVTYQPFVREEAAWTLAAYPAAGVRALFGGGDNLPEVRARIAACRRLGVPVVLMQHGALNRHDRLHHFGGASLVWGRPVVADLRAEGCRRRLHVVGWPQASMSLAAARGSRAARQGRAPWVIVTAFPSFDISGDPYGRGEVFLRDALRAVREVAPRARIVVKTHPRENGDAVRRFCAEHGCADAVVAGGPDGWSVIAKAEMVLSAKSTSAFAAVHLGVPVVVYHPSPTPAWFDRFSEIPVATSYDDLLAALRRRPSGSGPDAAARYARADTAAPVRVLAVLRREIRRGLRGSAQVPANAADTRP